jgi:hypothetical protein
VTPQPDYHDWPTKAEAAEAIGISIRQLERMLETGKIHTAFRTVPHRRAACVCDPVAVSRIAGERRAVRPTVERFASDAVPIWPATPSLVPADSAAGKQAVDLFLQRRGLPLVHRAVDLENKLYLTIEEAVEYSGLPASYLHKLIRQGGLLAVKADRWLRIGRKSLERL